MRTQLPTKIHLRRTPDGGTERSTDAIAWTLTNLSESDIGDNAEIRQLFQKLKEAHYVEDLENDLPLRTQHRIGRTLHRALFPPNIEVSSRWLHLVPVLDRSVGRDVERQNVSFLNFICRVPWMFLTRSDTPESDFLVRNSIDPASVTIDAGPTRERPDQFRDFKLPLHPTILLVIPTRERGEPTYGNEHLASLRKALVAAYKSDQIEAQLVHVRTREEFLTALEKYFPHIIYFYGHGDADDFSSRFLLDHPSREDWMDVDDIRDAIKNSPGWVQAPPVVWVNACYGATSVGNNFLIALSPVSCLAAPEACPTIHTI